MVADGSDQGQELLTKETLEEAKTLTNVEAAASEILTQEPRIDGHALKKVHTRNRKARAFTMSDEVHALLGALADRNGVTMSAYIETLILTADDFSIDSQVQDLLGVMANKAGKTRGQILELLVRQAETVLSWDPQINDRIGALAARNSMTRTAFLEALVLKAEGVLTWEPPQLKPKPWWKFWRQPQWEETSSPPLKHIVEAGSTPRLSSAETG